MQLLIITGNLGKDPEMRYTPTGQAVTSFSVAVNDKEKTLWFRVSAWDKQAETCNQYLKKGSKVQVVGRLIFGDNGGPRLYDTKDGKGASFEMTAQQVEFLTPKESAPDRSTEPGVEPF